jgi:prolyl oligopeptidase
MIFRIQSIAQNPIKKPMKNTLKLIPLLILAALGILLYSSAKAQMPYNPPKTPAQPVTNQMNGFSLTDNYQWLEDKKDPKVVEWTRQQHDATMKFLNETCPPVKGLREEIQAYLDRDIVSPMSLVADRQFFTVKKKGELQPKLFTKLNGKDVLLFDPLKIDPSGKSAFSGVNYTEKADKVAIGLQNKGAEISTYYIVDTKTGKMEGKTIEGLRGFSWCKDGKSAYITVGTKEMLEKQIPLKTYRHVIGTDRSKDQFIIAPADAKNFAYIYDTSESDLTFTGEGDFYATHTLKVKKIGSTEAPVEMYASKQYQATPNAIGDKIYIYTNHEAPNYKLMVADKNQPKFENWQVLYAEKETVMDGYTITPKFLLIQDKKDVLSRLLLHDLNGKFIKEIKLPEVANVSYASYNKDVKALFVGTSSFTSPSKIYRLNPDKLADNDLKWELFYEQPSPIDTKNIEAKIDFYTSKDGTKVPIFIMHRKGLDLNGENPTLLYGYGGFQVGISPSYVGLTASFINRGGVYAIAGIRGGDEYGEKWHLDGMMEKKQNCFDDFIAAQEFLINQKYTNSQKLALRGGSNGGLLIGAMLTQRPDLFKAAICAVPLLDMVRYHKFLIARYWIPEYGDPDKKADFQNILKYSPYHNIRVGLNLPTTMVTAGENDTRVDPLHAKKFVAALQNNVGQINPILLYMDYDSGHGSGKSTEQTIFDQEIQWRFVMNQLGMPVQ